MTDTRSTGAVEVVLYRTRPGVTDEQMLDASDALQRELERFPGYVSLRVLKSEDGQWIDLIDWASLDAALRSADAILPHPAAQAFLGLVGESTIQLLHLTPLRVYESSPTAS